MLFIKLVLVLFDIALTFELLRILILHGNLIQLKNKVPWVFRLLSIFNKVFKLIESSSLYLLILTINLLQLLMIHIILNLKVFNNFNSFLKLILINHYLFRMGSCQCIVMLFCVSHGWQLNIIWAIWGLISNILYWFLTLIINWAKLSLREILSIMLSSEFRFRLNKLPILELHHILFWFIQSRSFRSVIFIICRVFCPSWCLYRL
jgi:hypothetical protein